MHDWIQSLIAIFAIANPLGAAPVYLGLTEGMSEQERLRGAARAALAVFLILVVSALGGN